MTMVPAATFHSSSMFHLEITTLHGIFIWNFALSLPSYKSDNDVNIFSPFCDKRFNITKISKALYRCC